MIDCRLALPCTCLLALCLLIMPGRASAEAFAFEAGDHVCYVGNALADRKQHHGWLETYLQAAHPRKELVFRNLGVPGDQVHHRPRAHEDFGDADSHLAHSDATVIFAFFGYNESFDENPDQFKQRLAEWIDHTRQQQYDDETTPRIVLFSPIAHENLNDPNLPDGTENNRRLAVTAHAMAEVAEQKDVTFVDLFTATQAMYATAPQPLTINGVHLNSEGNRQVGRYIAQQLVGSAPDIAEEDLQRLREAVLDKNWHWHNRYRATSGNDVWGGRSSLHGNRETLQHELAMLDVMTANRDQRIWARAQGRELDIDDSNVPAPQEVETNFNREVEFLSPTDAIDRMRVAEGLQVNLFASEQTFPEIANPVQMQVDTGGRLWVAAWPTYPKWEPLKEMNDALVILEDTTGDGQADKSTTFAHVHNPTGFEFWNGGVIVVSAPDILFLKDTTGDDKADVRIRLLSAIDSADTHHTANNLVLGPDGWIYYQRGVFHLHNVETPWAQSHESRQQGLYRFNPRTHAFAFHVGNSPNPHGISFDRWGYQYITDATSGQAFQVYLGDNGQFGKRKLFDQTVRPVPGHQILSSGHLPEEFENNFLIYNVIGFLGIKRYELDYEDGVVRGTEIGDLLYSDDPNFRPTDGVVGNDGALYVSDWHNPIIGHMQHNLRDPSRDHTHGRIYRVTAEDRSPQDPVAIRDEPIDVLLDLLQHPVDSIRHRVRIELSGRNSADVVAAARERADGLNPEDAEQAHLMTELLWLHQQHNVVNRELLEALLESPVEHARLAAERVDWFWEDRPDDPLPAATADTDHAAHASAPAEGKAVDLTGDAVAEFAIKAVVEQMRYDTTEFTVRAGQQVKLTFENPDFMPHNLLVVEPGAADAVAMEAIEMGEEGFAKGFVPDHAKILQASSMLNHGQAEVLEFTAPAEAGDYPYVCTFPGHHVLMRGTMKVVD